MTGGDGPVVIKVGGSILRSPAAHRIVARLLANWMAGGPVWAVVSAAKGLTDALDRVGRARGPRSVGEVLALQEKRSGVAVDRDLAADLRHGVGESVGRPTQRLLAWGERASAAALRVHLARLGLDVPIVELTTRPRLPSVPTAIVPGFYIRDRGGNLRCLPRGGSDISAVLVAARLGGRSVRLWKGGGGIRVGPAGIVLEIDAAALLPRIIGDIRPLHPAALCLADEKGIDLILEDPFGRNPATRVVAGDRGRIPAGSRSEVAFLSRGGVPPTVARSPP